MTTPLKEAIARAALEIGRDSVAVELRQLGEELRGSVLARVVGFASVRAKSIKADNGGKKLTQDEIASIIAEIPAVARAARAAQQEQGGDDGAP